MLQYFDRPYLIAGLLYGALGMLLGIYMAASHNHQQLVTHAHLLLAGFLLSVVYAVIHRLWVPAPARTLAGAQFWLHHVGVTAMVGGLFVVYGQYAEATLVEPVLAGSSIAVLLALVLMLVIVVRSAGRPSPA